MQGQGHAWAQLNSHPSHVGESVALAERLVLLGVERLPFQVGLADLGRKAQGARSGGLSQPLVPPITAQGTDAREQEAQSRVLSHQHRAKRGKPHGSRDPTLLVCPTQGMTARESHGPHQQLGREALSSPHRRSKCRAS